MSTYDCNNFFIGLAINVAVLIDWKNDNYNAILVDINYLTKIVHFEFVKTIIDVIDLAKVIINVIMKHYNLSKSIISD